MTIGVGWTDERVAMLKVLNADGLSGSQIAVEMGGVSRNAVIGKLNRLGLVGTKPKTRARPHVPRRRRQLQPRLQKFYDTREGKPLDEPAPVYASDLDIPQAQRRTFMQLESHHCRWPVGDPGAPGFFFCGGWALPCMPYCEAHARIAYNKPVQRQRPAEIDIRIGLRQAKRAAEAEIRAAHQQAAG